MRKLLAVSAALVLVAAVAAFAGDADRFNDPPTIEERNATGFDYYMLEVPNGVNMVMDGSDADWAWFDPEYVMTILDFRDEADRPFPSRSDLDITAKLAWKGGTVNRWYVFMAIHDDTLRHDGTSPGRWDGDMLGMALDPTDHGRQDGTGYSMQMNAAPGDLTEADNYELRRVDPAPLGTYDDAPWTVGAIRVEPQEAWVTTNAGWTSATGGDTYYEFNMLVIDYLEDGGPAASTVTNLTSKAAANGGSGLPFAFWVEDGDPAFNNDITTRGSVG
ncbi:MAG: hypothetical protein ABIL09_09625, partial [Gemmatimonadota bacterium]